MSKFFDNCSTCSQDYEEILCYAVCVHTYYSNIWRENNMAESSKLES